MRRKCNQQGCKAPDAFCKELASPNYEECSHWTSDLEPNTKTKDKSKIKKNEIPWSGVAMEPKNIEQLSHRSTPQIVGIIGASGAGKTSFLGMLYTLLFNGKRFKEWNFAGSNTLIAWETQAKCLKVKPNGKVPFAEPTPRNRDYYSLYHLALRKGGHLSDVLFADSSGEVFTEWSKNTEDPNVENARWIYKNANSFILFISCEEIIERRGIARSSITQLMGQVAGDLQDRPVIIVWSKADRMEELERDYPIIKNAIEQSIKQYFPSSESIAISNFSKAEPDNLCHINNLAVAENIINKLNKPISLNITPIIDETIDLFFKYKGSYENK